MSSRRREIYLDNHASTRCDPRVVEAMLPYLLEHYANPSSHDHKAGRRSHQAVSEARSRLAELVGCTPGELVFTSGATESNNLALMGALGHQRDRRHIIVSAIEHKSVIEPAVWLEKQGCELSIAPVRPDGQIDLRALDALFRPNTLLVSVQHANNEIGTIQPLARIAERAHRVGALMHADCAQALGRINIDVKKLDVDLASFSGHKCYGPKGVGALYLRGGTRVGLIDPLMFGGGQESRLRPGTLNVPGIVGFGMAAMLAQEGLSQEAARLGALRNDFERHLTGQIPAIHINGDRKSRLPGNCSITLPPGVDGSVLIANTPELIYSSGSACDSGNMDPSHVLTAIGLSPAEAERTVRLGFGRYNSHEETELAACAIVNAWRKASTALLHA